MEVGGDGVWQLAAAAVDELGHCGLVWPKMSGPAGLDLMH